MGQVDTELLRAPLPAVRDYEDYLHEHKLLGHGFVFRELVRPNSHRHKLPPTRLWPRMVATLALANELRAHMIAAGARGLLIAAAYRPGGGAADSQHKHNAALDLDLLAEDRGRAGKFARIAALLWREHEELKVGFGTYAPERATWTNRVHIDTGYRFRCWQGTGVASFSKDPAALVLAPPDETDLLSREFLADGT